MSITSPESLFGTKSADDWRAAKAGLAIGSDPASWRTVPETFFRPRLELRYFEPIRILQDVGTFTGEGFSIVAIQCSLLEFLEATLQGKKYRYVQNPNQLANDEYSSSSRMFEDFLTSRQPFANDLTRAIAHDFYISVIWHLRSNSLGMLRGLREARSSVVENSLTKS